jgi:hypothetical protein
MIHHATEEDSVLPAKTAEYSSLIMNILLCLTSPICNFIIARAVASSNKHHQMHQLTAELIALRKEAAKELFRFLVWSNLQGFIGILFYTISRLLDKRSMGTWGYAVSIVIPRICLSLHFTFETLFQLQLANVLKKSAVVAHSDKVILLFQRLDGELTLVI